MRLALHAASVRPCIPQPLLCTICPVQHCLRLGDSAGCCLTGGNRRAFDCRICWHVRCRSQPGQSFSSFPACNAKTNIKHGTALASLMSSWTAQPKAAPPPNQQAACTRSGSGQCSLVQWLCRFVATRVLVIALVLTRFLQIEIRNELATSLYGSPLDNPGQTWRLVW